jgi:phosphoglycolate phosphatase-like HAD superfamily hydrolase
VTQDLLDLDVRLLILRHGRAKVLQALAVLGEQTVEELERQMQALGQRTKPKKRAQPELMDLVAEQAGLRPEIGAPLRALAVAFENRTFLPQLRDVQRFLDRIGAPHGKLKSRTAAAPALIRALARLGAEELARLTDDKPGSDSEYSLLARAIMGTQPAKPSDRAENK